MELLKSSKRRSVVSELAYIVLNIGLAATLLVLVLAIDSPIAAVVLILLSKWRVLAVRPRYWIAHIKANLVDIIVGMSFVVLLYGAADALAVQVVLAALYAVWLLIIKPKSRRIFVTIQAAVALFMGVTALMMVSYDLPSSVIVVAMWVIGYVCTRHILGSYDEPLSGLFGVIWGLVIAEIGWLLYHWSYAYTIPGIDGLKLSQAALIAVGLSFVAERVYDSYHHHGHIRSGDIILPILLVGSVILTMLVFFNTATNTIL